MLRYHYALPKMDVVSLGLAGGSIISIDPRTGTPRIGPRSAGSYPGPVCYDHDGEEPTITDIDAVLDYLNPRYFLGGRAELDIEGAPRLRGEGRRASWSGPPPRGCVDVQAHEQPVLRPAPQDDRAARARPGASRSSRSVAPPACMSRYTARPSASPTSSSPTPRPCGAFELVTSDIAHEDQITHPLRARSTSRRSPASTCSSRSASPRSSPSRGSTAPTWF